MARALSETVAPDRLTVIVNVGDDLVLLTSNCGVNLLIGQPLNRR